MSKTAFAGLLLCVLTVLALTPSAHAESVALFEQTTEVDNNIKLASEVIAPKQKDVDKPAKKQKDQPEKHVVAKGESLTKIAKKYDVDWKKVFYKNTEIDNPDTIVAGDVIVIPEDDEKLKTRPIPASEPEQQVAEEPETSPAVTSQAASNTVRSYSSSSGNTYTYGYCTWYVKNRRADLPNGLGNAYEWVGNARALGLATGSTPRVGAAGQRGNHVVYVEKVHSDNTVTISEMNRVAWNVKSSRRVPASYFTYIY